jgi:hypothetical protein
MPSIADVEAKLWQSVVSTLQFNETLAIPKKWRALKAAGSPIGVPLTDEIELDRGHKAQGFTSGHVLVWVGGDTVEVH